MFIVLVLSIFQVNSEGKEKDGSGASYYKICNARLPRGLDPHSVPSEELAASLGLSLLTFSAFGFLVLNILQTILLCNFSKEKLFDSILFIETF